MTFSFSLPSWFAKAPYTQANKPKMGDDFPKTLSKKAGVPKTLSKKAGVPKTLS